MILKTLKQMGPLHGYGIAQRIEQISEDVIGQSRDRLYLCLMRLLQKRWISGRWGTSENNRKAKFYAITRAGRPSAHRRDQELGTHLGVMAKLFRPSPLP